MKSGYRAVRHFGRDHVHPLLKYSVTRDLRHYYRHISFYRASLYSFSKMSRLLQIEDKTLHRQKDYDFLTAATLN